MSPRLSVHQPCHDSSQDPLPQWNNMRIPETTSLHTRYSSELTKTVTLQDREEIYGCTGIVLLASFVVNNREYFQSWCPLHLTYLFMRPGCLRVDICERCIRRNSFYSGGRRAKTRNMKLFIHDPCLSNVGSRLITALTGKSTYPPK